MRCKKHPSDLSSSVGVCASCLRERLFVLIAAQAQAQAEQPHSLAALEDCRKSDPHHPPPLIFPRSVSPYVSRRKSDDASIWSNHHHQFDHRFFSTPQLGPTYSSTTTTTNFSTSRSCKKKHSRFSLFSNLFRTRSDKTNSDPRVSSRDSCEPSSSSPSWFSMIFTRKKQPKVCYLDDFSTGERRPRRRTDRGMSPAGGVDNDEDCDYCDRSPSGNGYSTEASPQRWRRTPVATPQAVRRGRPGHGRNVSGLTFCLSPLVRASPNRHWNQKGSMPPDVGYSGEFRPPMKPHLSTAASFCANRSRKLADFGRVNHNR